MKLIFQNPSEEEYADVLVTMLRSKKDWMTTTEAKTNMRLMNRMLYRKWVECVAHGATRKCFHLTDEGRKLAVTFEQLRKEE